VRRGRAFPAPFFDFFEKNLSLDELPASQAALPANFILGKLLVKLQDNFQFYLANLFAAGYFLCTSTPQAALRT